MTDATATGLALRLYESLLDGAGLLTAVQGLADQLGASSHAVHQLRLRDGKPAASISAASGAIAAPAVEEYARFWVRHDPWAKACARLPLGVHDMARHVPPDEFARSRIWNEWGRPNDAGFHTIGILLDKRDDRCAGLHFHRRASQTPFGPREEALATALFPHLRRVFAADSTLAAGRDATGPALRAGLDALAEGVVLLDADRRLAFANTALRRMAREQDGISLACPGGLDTPEPKSRMALSRAVTAALAALDGQVGLLPFAGSLAIPRPSGGAPWLVRALPVMRSDAADAPPGFRGAMLLVTDGGRRGKPNATLLQRLYGLTPAQASLAAALAAGRTLQDHAMARHISVETARSHLAAIRRKTGCRRQADLAALLARLPG